MTLDLATVRAYVQVPATALSDEDLTRMLDAAEDIVGQLHEWPDVDDAGNPVPRPATLDQWVLRNVQRQIAARNLPLGMVGLDAMEYGPAAIPTYDALLRELGAPYRRMVLG